MAELGGTLGHVDVPGIGRVPVRIKRTVKSINPDGTGVLRVFVTVDIPPLPGGGEPLPIKEVA